MSIDQTVQDILKESRDVVNKAEAFLQGFGNAKAQYSQTLSFSDMLMMNKPTPAEQTPAPELAQKLKLTP